MRKTESAISRCKTISTIQKLLSGKYKIELLWYNGKCDVRRFGQLRRQIGEITESSLTKQLREESLFYVYRRCRYRRLFCTG